MVKGSKIYHFGHTMVASLFDILKNILALEIGSLASSSGLIIMRRHRTSISVAAGCCWQH
jgi:hypothetical protein